jgi:hypothetical protein
MAGLYYEEFSVGQEFLHPWTRTTLRYHQEASLRTCFFTGNTEMTTNRPLRANEDETSTARGFRLEGAEG